MQSFGGGSAQSIEALVARLPTPARARKGIWQCVQIRYGNMVSHSERKTRRRWEPNVQKINFYSELLEESISIPVTTRALRTIDKKGGIDNYILFSKPSLYEGSEVAQSLFQRLRLCWEEREQRPFSRSQEVLNARLEGLRLDRPFQMYVREKEEKEKNKKEDSQSKTA